MSTLSRLLQVITRMTCYTMGRAEIKRKIGPTKTKEVFDCSLSNYKNRSIGTPIQRPTSFFLYTVNLYSYHQYQHVCTCYR